jgi:hypothetical protein
MGTVADPNWSSIPPAWINLVLNFDFLMSMVLVYIS